MAKVKKKARLHAKAARAQASTTSDVTMERDPKPSTNFTKALSTGGGVFSKLDIDMEALTKRLGTNDDGDTRSVVTSKSLRGLNLKKKDKLKLKHAVWRKRVETLEEIKKEAKAKKKREKTAVVGDMRPLEDALPTLELLLKKSTAGPKSERPTGKPKAIKSVKARRKQTANDLSVFKQVLEHPTYRSNPLATIKEHLQVKMSLEDS